jgi:hypothetical protein
MLLACFALAIVSRVGEFVRDSRRLDIELLVIDSMEPGSLPHNASAGNLSIAHVLGFGKSAASNEP